MSEGVDVERIRLEAGPCPRCGASAAKPILWGYPTEDDFERFGNSVGWGGCVVPALAAAYVCDACGQEYGVAQLGDDDDEELQE